MLFRKRNSKINVTFAGYAYTVAIEMHVISYNAETE